MAKAGFIFQPLPSNPDNVSCFLCNKALDGWEQDDNPLDEHLKHSPECGWAITAAVEAELGGYAVEDPRDALMVEARKATFAGRWPHEGKKGWSCKTKQVSLSSSLPCFGFLFSFSFFLSFFPLCFSLFFSWGCIVGAFQLWDNGC